MPNRSFTLEMWARGAAVVGDGDVDDLDQQKSTELFSYATRSYSKGETPLQTSFIPFIGDRMHTALIYLF